MCSILPLKKLSAWSVAPMVYIGDQLKGHCSDPGKRWWELGVGWYWFLVSTAGCMVVSFTEMGNSARETPYWGHEELNFGHVDFALSIRVPRREGKWEVEYLHWGDISHALSLCAALITLWVGTDEFWDPLKPWRFMILCSLTFEIDMKERLYIFLFMSLYANGNEIFLWRDFETYLL